MKAEIDLVSLDEILIIIYMMDDTEVKLLEIAQEKGKTVPKIIQEMIINQINQKPKKLPKSIGMGASRRSDLSSKVDDLLWTED